MKTKLKKVLFIFFLFSVAVLPLMSIDLWDAIKFNGPSTLVDKWKVILYSNRYASDINLDEVRQALEEGANVNRKNENGWSVFLHAAWLGHSDLVKLLLENEADVNQQDSSGMTALMHAAFSGNSNVARVLLEYKADPDKQDRNGMTALIRAAHHNPNIVKSLLAHGADPSKRANNGDTALSFALRFVNFKANPDLKERRSEAIKLLRRAEEDKRVSKEKR